MFRLTQEPSSGSRSQCVAKIIVMVPERGTAVAQWLKCCATNRKVAGSTLNGVIENFH